MIRDSLFSNAGFFSSSVLFIMLNFPQPCISVVKQTKHRERKKRQSLKCDSNLKVHLVIP